MTDRPRHYCIIGNSTAAIAAVESIRRVDKQGEITLIAEEPYHTYARPLISYYLSGQVGPDQLLYRPKDFYQKNRVAALLGVRATRLDTGSRIVYLDSEIESLHYDACLLATGSRAWAPPIPGIDLAGVGSFWTLDDAIAWKRTIQTGERVVVLGAGLVGMKAAEALVKLGCQVRVVEAAPRILPAVLTQSAAANVQAWFEQHGVEFQLGTGVAALEGRHQVETVALVGGKQLRADKVVLATGVRPRLELAEDTPIAFDRGLLVNQWQETTVSGVFSAGDVCVGFDRLRNCNQINPILPNAHHQGRIAGFNMAGEERMNEGIIPFNATSFFGRSLITMGFSQENELDMEEITESTTTGSRSLFFQGNKLVGATLINAGQRAGILLSLIRERFEVADPPGLLRSVPQLLDFPDLPRQEQKGGGPGEICGCFRHDL